MNEITRIHIAKIPYDIEVLAKKDLEKYIDKLELYADDSDWFEDIEIRITELFGERGIEKDGIITSDDVKAIREQLGEPQEFLGDGDIAVDLEKENIHRLYRDLDTAVVGGVLGGVAKYFGFNPLWARLIFIVLLFLSFGTVVIVYLVLWLVVPPARTATEKLQVAGKPVTLASIKELREQEDGEDSTNRVAKNMQGILVYAFGILFAIGAVVSLVVTIAIGSRLFASQPDILGGYVSGTVESWIVYILLIISGILLTSLFIVIATAFFKKKYTKRIGIIMAVIMLSGVAIFGSAIGTTFYTSWQENVRISNSQFTKKENLSERFKSVKNLVVDTNLGVAEQNNMSNARVEYIVDTGMPRYELTLDANTKMAVPATIYSNGDKTATLNIDGLSTNKNNRYNAQTFYIKIYGPALDNINVKSGSTLYDNKNGQNDLSAKMEGGSFELTGSYKNFSVATENDPGVILSNATIENLTANLKGGYVTAGVIRNLNAIQSDVCPANNNNNSQNRLIVQTVSSGKLLLNGTEKNASTITQPCGGIIIRSEGKFEAFSTN